MTKKLPSSRTTHHICQLRAGTVRFGDKLVFSGIELVIGRTEHVALIGENGAGKSTLLGVLSGSVELNDGERLIDPATSLAVAEQHPIFPPGATVAHALDLLLRQLRGIESRMREIAACLEWAPESEHPALLKTLAELTEEFEGRDGYRLDVK